MEQFLNYYKTHSKAVSDYSLLNFINSVRRIVRMIELPANEWTINTFKDSQEFVCLLNAKYSYNTAILTINSLIYCLRCLNYTPKYISEYRDYLNDYIEIRDIHSHNNVLTEEQSKNWLEYTELKSKVIALNEYFLKGTHAFTKYRNYLILALYTLAYPVRLGNYIGMLHLKQNEDPNSLPRTHNYIIRDREGYYTFVFNKYKTSKTIGQIIYKPEEIVLHRLIAKYFANYTKNQRLFLVNTQGKNMSQTNLSNALTSVSSKLLGKTLTLNTIRQIFITEFLKKEQTIKEKKRILKIIGQVYNPSSSELYCKV
jgi:hypothetical protein